MSIVDSGFITEMKDKNGDSWYHQIVVETQQDEIERLNNIIKEVREYIKDYFYIDKETGEYYLTHTFGSSNLYELSKILNEGSDKE